MTERPTAGQPTVGVGAAIVAAALFAWLGPLARWAYEGGMEPLPFVAWRAGIGALTLAALVAVATRRGRAFIRPTAFTRREAASLGLAILSTLTVNLAMFAAFGRMTVALTLIAFYTYPAMVAAVAILLGREAVSRPVLAALALALAGMVVVVAGSLDTAGGIVADQLGIVLALGAAAAQTVFVTVSRDGYPRLPVEQATAIILAGIFGGSVVIGLAISLGPELTAPIGHPNLLALVLVAGAAGAAVPTLLLLMALRRIGGTRSGILMLLEPVVATVIAAILLGEALRPVQVVGAAAVLAAAMVLQRSHRPADAPVPRPVLAAREAVPDSPPTR